MQEFPKYLHTAGKITVLTSLIGVVVFAVVFLLNIGAQEFQHVEAQIATTSITVLNTPPAWTVDAQEETESSTSTPTNSGTSTTWIATATDSNAAPYFLLICSTSNAATATAAAGPAFLGTAPPTCNGGTQWAVSASTTSGTQATAATTTEESWAESNDWFAFVCDDDPVNPRCNSTVKQGTATTASPFNVNHRPTFSAYSDDSGKLPGEVVTFTATSTDNDSVDVADTMQLHVCSTASFSATNTSCNALTLATSSFATLGAGVDTLLTATYTITIPTRDTNYGAFGYVVDVHGHLASGGQQGTDSVLTVSNALPTVSGSDITLNNGADMTLTQEAAETTGFELYFNVTDNNSCDAVGGTNYDEITGYEVSVFRSTVGSSSCAVAGDYDANNCYTSTVATTTWDLACTASTTSCTHDVDSTDRTLRYDCTFPLWYIADPTDGGATNTVHFATDWSAAVSGVDEVATGTMATSSIRQEVVSFMALALDTATIPFSDLEPGNRTDPLLATTTVRAVGNVGLDELLSGEAMCGTYTSAVTCPNSASSTINENYLVFATSSVSYGNATSSGFTLSSTTYKELEVNIEKSTSTVTQKSGVTYWGIEVPVAITLSGLYTGENTFIGKTAEPADWTP